MSCVISTFDYFNYIFEYVSNRVFSKTNNILWKLWIDVIYSNKTNNYRSNNSKMAEDRFSIFDICFENGQILKSNIRYLLWYLLWGRMLRPRTTLFLLCLLFNLVILGSCFALTTNLEAGPRFAGIWFIVICMYPLRK